MKTNEDVRITLRLPSGLREQVKASSDRSGRSMNAEIITLLQTALEGSQPDDAEPRRPSGDANETADYSEVSIDGLVDTETWIRVLSDTNSTLKLLARTIGHVFLTDGDSSEIFKIIATELSQIQVDDVARSRRPKK